MMYLGDYAEDATLHFKWNSFDSSGASITRSTDGTIYVYKDGATGTEVTTGVTDTEDFDSLTGVHHCTIDLSSAAFYATGADYTVVLKAATIDSQTVNAVLAHFSIENRFDEVDVTKISGDSTAADNLESACDNYSATRGLAGTALPAAAADGAGGLVVSDAGGLDIDALDARCSEVRLGELDPANMPADLDTTRTAATTAVTNTGNIESDTQDIQTKIGVPTSDLATELATVDAVVDDLATRLPAALVGGRMDSDVGNIQSGAIDADAIASDAITAGKIAADAIDASELAAGAVTEITSSVALYLVMADAIYSGGSLDVSASLVKNGVVQTAVSNARASLYQLDGTLIDALTTVASPDGNGEFKFPTLSRTLAQNTMYYVVVTIEDATTGGTDRSANVKVKRFI